MMTDTYMATCWIEIDGVPLIGVVVRQQAESPYGFKQVVAKQLLQPSSFVTVELAPRATVSFGPIGHPWGRRA